MGNLNAQTAQVKTHQLSPQHGDGQLPVTGYQSLVSAQSQTVQQQPSSYAQPRPQIRHYYPHATPESQDDYCIYCSFEEYSPKFQQLPVAMNYDCKFGGQGQGQGQDPGQNQKLDRQDNSETRRYSPENKGCSQLNATYRPPQELIGRIHAQVPKPSSAFGAAAGRTEALVSFSAKFLVPIPDAPWPYGIGVNASQKMKDNLRAQAYPLYMNAAEIQVLERRKQAESETRAITVPSMAKYPAPMRPVDLDMLIPSGLWKVDDGSWETHQGRPHAQRDYVGKQQPASASYLNPDQSHGHSHALAGQFPDPVSVLSTARMSSTMQINTSRVRDKAHDQQQSQLQSQPPLPRFDGETGGLPRKSPHGVIGQHLDDLHDGYRYPNEPAASPAQLNLEAVLDMIQVPGGVEVEVGAGAGAVYNMSNSNAPVRICGGQGIKELLVGSTRDGD
ncbi:hypothetical protein CFO_g3381 [Ceratocystis platani]|uniref:Uncharacterized protein n=1 Tax=Ceratocystis fimbriata f. sp. platani TaxID=88771 RepID=A0A0F8BNZ1_CERFI|nr:hypothetical protein CFO_g3381 [Ceratocystis platani]